MPDYHVTIESTKFTPAEAAKFTGVSTALQRDWRRRGILPARGSGKHHRFTFEDLCEMTALKAFSDAGFGPKAGASEKLSGNFRDADSTAHMCMLPMLHYANFEVHTSGPEIGRYVIIDGEGICRVPDLAKYQQAVDAGVRNPGSVMVAFDCKAAVEKLMAAINRPAFTKTVTVMD